MTSETKFSAGPWCMEGRWLGHDMGNGVQSGPMYQLSPLITGTLDRNAAEEDAANLALITAAPEMYHALTATEIILRNRDQTEQEARLLCSVKMILARAEGRT